jgi:predicted RNA methylase
MSKRRVEKCRAKFAGKVAGLEEQIKIRDAKDNKFKEAQVKIGELEDELLMANEQIMAIKKELGELIAVPGPAPQADMTDVEPVIEG